MSGSWLKTAGFLCLVYVTQIDGETKGVTWKHVGESITIKCNSAAQHDSMNLFTGLNKEVQLLFVDKGTNKCTRNQNITGRTQVHWDFPEVSLLILNLTLKDTGPYWCMYNNYNDNFEQTEGEGSLLLVVTEKKKALASVMPQCDASLENKVTLIIGIAGGVLLIIACVMWILLKVRPSCRRSRSECGARNDVYEEMRGTLKR